MSYEYQVDVGGVMYDTMKIKSVDITQPLFERLSVGNTCSAEMLMSFWPDVNPPRMAKIVAYEREVGTTDWKQLGIFNIDTRTKRNGLLSIVAYDAMLRSEALWPATATGPFPMLMTDAVDIIKAEMDVELDERTVLDQNYTINKPASTDSMRNVLSYIAAANGGNWIITAEGKLLLVPLFGSMPEETHYLVTESGDAITFGGTIILV